jgi:putative membrane-bound dehydrogenase-like protein
MKVHHPVRLFAWFAIAACCSVLAQQPPGWQFDRDVNRDALPTVPPGFDVSFFAREPLVRQPCSMAFDAKGRLCVGMGQQYRNPKPETPGDSVVLVLDTDGDGRADRTKTFATGFNAIQGLAWHGRDLWVANAPDLTVVRDLDGDDEADEYVRVFTDLGNLEHGLHGLNWAPDGKLYMSKGNSKGLTQPGRIAPKGFRDLWGVTAPPGSPDFPAPRTFKKGEYQKAYHDPEDDWGREGGVLRCDDGGRNLEIVSRGMRNPWDITFDAGFNWLGTDNDQTTGDRVIMPFFGAHFGWNHPWSAHWGTGTHPPSAPVSGPLFEGSGTGVIFGDSPQFPPTHRGVFFVNDWLRKTTFVWRPRWDGALLRPAGEWEPFVQGGKALFRPTDVEAGPDGALWILGWSAGYGAEYQDGQMTSEGRVFRVVATNSPPARWQTPKRSQPLAQWTVAELVEDFDGSLPVWRIDAQDELVRRGAGVKGELLSILGTRGINEARETWTAWTLGRLTTQDRTIDKWFSARAADSAASLNLRVQSLRILAHRVRHAGAGGELPVSVVRALHSPEPRLRFEAVQAIGQAAQHFAVPVLLDLLAAENDPATFYATWQTLRGLQDATALKPLLADARGGVRKAVLLALLEDHALQESEVKPLTADSVQAVSEVASLWLRNTSGGGEAVVVRGRPLNAAAPEAATSVPGAGLARNIKARSGKLYQLAPGGLRPGAKPYTDRGYALKNVPAALAGMDFIQTANNDDGSRGDGWLSFEALMPVRVHIAFDTRAVTMPAWLRENFRRNDQRIQADHWTFQLYSRDYPAGRIELGGNADDGKPGGKGNYIVVLELLPLTPPSGATATDPTLALLPKGDRERGEWLFYARGGAGCFNCHRLGEHGNSFGPNLATLGDRATAQHIVQSMLEPNAIITEGFNLQLVETADTELSGILLEESGLSVTLGLATGQRQTILKSIITSRKTAAVSAMPSYETLLSPQYVADLTAYLLARKAGAPSIARPEVSGAPTGSSDGFRVEPRADSLAVSWKGRALGDYVFRDAKILRPYFARLHAPDGTQVTRNFPPVKGQDATDHDTMHPGLALAFGDLNGVDFWRNKGRIEHVRFVRGPRVEGGRLLFTAEERYLATDGAEVCRGTNEFCFIAGETLQPALPGTLLMWSTTLRHADGPLTFGPQHEMGLGIRIATPLVVKGGTGSIVSSHGGRNEAGNWGRIGTWWNYSGTMNGRHAGVLVVVATDNSRPVWSHARDYGFLAVNPTGPPPGGKDVPSLPFTVATGEPLRLKFGVLLHASPEPMNPAKAAPVVSAELKSWK